MDDIANETVAVSRPGSGSRFTADKVIEVLQIDVRRVEPTKDTPFDEMMGRILYDDKVAAGFFVNSVPTPQVAYLLSDPGSHLLSLRRAHQEYLTSQDSMIARPVLPYLAYTIPGRTYPNQLGGVDTVAVITVLLCRKSLEASIVEEVTAAVLDDLGSSDSKIWEVQAGVDTSVVEELTARANKTLDALASVMPLNPGAKRARDALPIWEREPAFLHLLGLELLAFSLFGASVSWLPDVWRLRLLLTFLRPIPVVSRSLEWPLMNPKCLAVLRPLSAAIVVWLSGAFAIHYFEKDINVNFNEPVKAMVSVVVYLFSGLGNREPQTGVGWAVAVLMMISNHCCPVKSRIESIGWGHREIRLGSRMAGVPVKGAFFRIA